LTIVEFERSTFLMVYPILITGASRGLGKSLAIELSKKFHVIAVARTTGGLEALDDHKCRPPLMQNDI
jgi:short-subunit dehydrogenase